MLGICILLLVSFDYTIVVDFNLILAFHIYFLRSSLFYYDEILLLLNRQIIKKYLFRKNTL